MGNNASIEYDLKAELRGLRMEMGSFQKRLAGLEKDVSNFGVILNRVHESRQENSNALLNLSLLEEGRSMYRRPKRHTASSYN
ncbi:unnamed protein product [Sphacelaria rigidula]